MVPSGDVVVVFSYAVVNVEVRTSVAVEMAWIVVVVLPVLKEVLAASVIAPVVADKFVVAPVDGTDAVIAGLLVVVVGSVVGFSATVVVVRTPVVVVGTSDVDATGAVVASTVVVEGDIVISGVVDVLGDSIGNRIYITWGTILHYPRVRWSSAVCRICSSARLHAPRIRANLHL